MIPDGVVNWILIYGYTRHIINYRITGQEIFSPQCL